MTFLSGAVVVAAALYLLGLALAAYVRPSCADRFLLAFASTARAHYAEQAARLAVGGALVAFSPEMAWTEAFRLFGWVLVVTALGLLAVPWRWHRRFAQRVLPPVLQRPRLYGLGAAVLGAALLWGVLAGRV